MFNDAEGLDLAVTAMVRNECNKFHGYLPILAQKAFLFKMKCRKYTVYQKHVGYLAK